jgi:hypothetical protein
MTPGEESRTGMIKIQRVWELILDVALENTDKARTRQMCRQKIAKIAKIAMVRYQKICHHDVLAGRCCALQMKMNKKKGKLAIFKLAIFIIENILDDEDGVRSFFGES